jgi:hypothetical protein
VLIQSQNGIFRSSANWPGNKTAAGGKERKGTNREKWTLLAHKPTSLDFAFISPSQIRAFSETLTIVLTPENQNNNEVVGCLNLKKKIQRCRNRHQRAAGENLKNSQFNTRLPQSVPGRESR